MSEIEFEQSILVGYANPPGVKPCFAVPIFKPSLTANTHTSQIIDGNGLILGFRQISIGNTDIFETDPVEVEAGQQPICVFIDHDGKADIKRLDALQTALRQRAPNLELRPFMALEVAEFAGIDRQLVSEARVNAYNELQRRSPGSANFWRNSLVFLPQVREAIRAMLSKYNAHQHLPEIEEIEFGLNGSDATISVPSSIHSFLTDQSKNWKAEVEKAISLDAKTFGIESIVVVQHSLNIKVQPDRSDANQFLLRTLVIAIGPLSQKCAGHLLDKNKEREPEKPHSFADATYSLDRAVFATSHPFIGLLDTRQINDLDEDAIESFESRPSNGIRPRPTGYENLNFVAIIFDRDLKSIRSAITVAQHYSSIGCITVGVPTERRLIIEHSLHEVQSIYEESAFDFIFDISNAFVPKRKGRNESLLDLTIRKVRECIGITHTIPSIWEIERKQSNEAKSTWLVVSSSNRKSFQTGFVDAQNGLSSESFLPLKAAGLLIITREMSEFDSISAINMVSNLFPMRPDNILVTPQRHNPAFPSLTLLARDSSDNFAKRRGRIFEIFCETLLKDHGWLVSRPDREAHFDFVAQQDDLSCLIECKISPNPKMLIGKYSQVATKPAIVVLIATLPNAKDAWILWQSGIRALHYSKIKNLTKFVEFLPTPPIDELLVESESKLRRIIWPAAIPIIIRQMTESNMLGNATFEEDVRLSRPRIRKNLVDGQIEITGDIELLGIKDGERRRFTAILDCKSLYVLDGIKSASPS